jgi:hypothetical protein
VMTCLAAVRSRWPWLTMMTARLSRQAVSHRSRVTSWPVFASTLAVGSSARITRGSSAKDRAMTTRCFAPPERSRGRFRGRCSSSSCSSAILALARASFREAHAVTRGTMTFFSAVSAESRLKVWKTKPNSFSRSCNSSAGPRVDLSRPEMRMRPAVGDGECRPWTPGCFFGPGSAHVQALDAHDQQHTECHPAPADQQPGLFAGPGSLPPETAWLNPPALTGPPADSARCRRDGVRTGG